MRLKANGTRGFKGFVALLVALSVVVGMALPVAASSIVYDDEALNWDDSPETHYSSVRVATGESIDLTEYVRTRNYSYDIVEWTISGSIRWESSYPTVGTVDGNGVVTTHRAGVTTVTATYWDNLARQHVHRITVGVSGLGTGSTTTATTANSFEINEGKRIDLSALIDPTGTLDGSITWTTTNSGIATVSSSGLVEGYGVGRVTIAASYTDTAGTLREEKIAVRVGSLVLADSWVTKDITISVPSGTSVDLASLYYPNYEGAARGRLSASASSSDIVSCEGATITAKGTGTCIVTLHERDGRSYDDISSQRFTLTVTAS